MEDFLNDRFDRIQEDIRENRWQELPLAVREPRQVWERSNPLIEYNEADFKAHFRFNRDNFFKLVDLVKGELNSSDKRGLPLSPLQQLALTLAFYASGAFQRICGQMLGVKKACAHQTIKRGTTILSDKSHEFIKMPTAQEMRDSARGLYERFNIPFVALCVDGTHIKLEKKPSEADLPDGVCSQDFWCR